MGTKHYLKKNINMFFFCLGGMGFFSVFRPRKKIQKHILDTEIQCKIYGQIEWHYKTICSAHCSLALRFSFFCLNAFE